MVEKAVCIVPFVLMFWQHFAIGTAEHVCANADSQILPVGKIVLSSGRLRVTSPVLCLEVSVLVKTGQNSRYPVA